MFFECSIKHCVSSSDLRVKAFSYIVEAPTFSVAEANCYLIMKDMGIENFSIDNIKKTDIDEINYAVPQGESEDAYYTSVKVELIAENESTGNDIIVGKRHHLVYAEEFDSAIDHVKGLHNLSDISFNSAKKTNVLDVYEYESLRELQNAHGSTES